MKRVRKAADIAIAAVAFVFAGHASAQKWPEKTVRIVTPFATGDGTDFFSRIPGGLSAPGARRDREMDAHHSRGEDYAGLIQ